MVKTYDIVIVGASIAGASLALRLSRSGISCAVVDKSSFPRRKACGEGLSDLAVKKLCELGLGDELFSKENHPFFGYSAWIGDYCVDIAVKKPLDGQPKGIGIQRYELDRVLVSKLAQSANADTFLGEKVRAVSKNVAGYQITTARREIQCKYVVLADGANSILASRLGVPCKTSKSPSWGISREFEGRFSKPMHNVAIVVKKGFEIYCTPVAEGKVNVCLLARKHLIAKLSRPEIALPEIEKALRRVHFTGTPIGEAVNIGPIANCRRPTSKENILLVGDALESLDPIGGMGMTHALITSELVANTLHAIFCESIDAKTALKKLAKQRNRAVRPYRGFTRLTVLLLRGTRNNARALDVLAKTPLPAKVRDVLGMEFTDTMLPKTVPAAVLMLLGY